MVEHFSRSRSLIRFGVRACVAFGLAWVASVAIAPIASAHPGHGGSGLGYGFQHPLSGFDHMVAMVAIGLWAAQLGGSALWLVPISFVGVMVLGGLAGIAGVPLIGVEPGIVASGLILGALIMAAVRLPLGISMAIAGGLALFHGYAHGGEMPQGGAGLQGGFGSYALGFVLATALLHLIGLGLGLLVHHWGRSETEHPAVLTSEGLVRLAGVAVFLAGVYVVVGAIA